MADEPKEPSHNTENAETSETEKEKPPQPTTFKTLGDLYPYGFNTIPFNVTSVTHLPRLPVNLNLERLHEFASAFTALQARVATQTRELQAVQMAQEKEEKLRELQATYSALEEKARLAFLLSRVNQDAQRLLLQSEEFRNKFLNSESCEVFVVSVDIRRSTELMLKSRSPKQFASFITTLCNRLINIVIDNYGVVDKFTGDGILAFFPDFYSGEDAGYYALNAASHFHQAFNDIYKTSRNSFTSILKDAGLGIGIDYGIAHLVQLADGLTVVGVPVVYACRMAGGHSGLTLLNQPAYEIVSQRFSQYFFITESEIEIKHEGSTLAYIVMPSGKFYTPKKPDWIDFQQQDAKE